MDLFNELRGRLMDWGASFAGYSRVGDKLPQSLAGLEYAITIGVRLSDFIINEIKDSPTYTYFHHYRAVNTLIDQITLRAMLTIQDMGHAAVAVPASQTVNDADESYCAIFPHKTAAVLAGLGWIGKNGLFISTDYGPRVRLGTILTNLKLPVRAKAASGSCGECRKCVESCPALALTGNCWQEGCNRSYIFDAKACSDYMNSTFKHIGRGSVCGICMRVCPHGEKGNVYFL